LDSLIVIKNTCFVAKEDWAGAMVCWGRDAVASPKGVQIIHLLHAGANTSFQYLETRPNLARRQRYNGLANQAILKRESIFPVQRGCFRPEERLGWQWVGRLAMHPLDGVFKMA
jgi:hypothetical protein